MSYMLQVACHMPHTTCDMQLILLMLQFAASTTFPYVRIVNQQTTSAILQLGLPSRLTRVGRGRLSAAQCLFLVAFVFFFYSFHFTHWIGAMAGACCCWLIDFSLQQASLELCHADELASAMSARQQSADEWVLSVLSSLSSLTTSCVRLCDFEWVPHCSKDL